MLSPKRTHRPAAARAGRASWLAAALAAALALAWLLPAGARADHVAATLDSADVTLAATDGGGWTAGLGVTNLTDGDLSISAQTETAIEGCEALTFGKEPTATVPAAHHADLTVSAKSGCPSDKAVPLVLNIEGTGGTAVTQDPLQVSAAPKQTQTVHWQSLSSFLYCTVGGLVLMLIVWAVWAARGSAVSTRKGPFQTLSGLTASWSFKDSVASNLTAASGLVAVVLGSSDFLKTTLGPKAEAAIAGAAIAGAVALALIGAAGVIALTVRPPSSKYIAIGGLLLGTGLALGAAGGQVWAVTRLLNGVDLGSVGEPVVTVASWAATGLLVVYGSLSVFGLLEQGTKAADTDPLAPPAPVEIAAAAISAAAATGTSGDLTYDKVTALIGKLTKPSDPPAAGSPAAAAAAAALASAQPEPGLPLAERSALP